MDKLFKLTENQTTVGTEIVAGITTFFSMSYIIFLNPVFLSSTGMNTQGVLIATCISAAIGCILCGFISNKPFALASGMGMNAFFAYTLCGLYEYTWNQALAMTFISGVLFLIIILSPVRKSLLTVIPENLKHGISAGIGLFIALIGLINSGFVTFASGFPAVGDIKSTSVIIALIGLLVTSILVILENKGAVLLGMTVTVILNLVFGQTSLPDELVSLPTDFSHVFMKMDFSGIISHNGQSFASFAAIIISMTVVDIFDTLGFLIGAGSKTNVFTAEKKSESLEKILIADAAATVAGSLCGTSTVTTYAESATGISAGGRTGLTSITVAIGFLLFTFLSPLSAIITAEAVAPALIVVGMFLLADIRNVNFSSMSEAIPAFLTIIAIPFTYSITTGIAAGFISYVICKAAAREFKAISPATLVLSSVFVLYFLL